MEAGRKRRRRRSREDGTEEHAQGSEEETLGDLMEEEEEEVGEGSDNEGYSGASECDDKELDACPSYQVSVRIAVELVVEFVQPFAEEIHARYVASNGGSWDWTNRQSHCIAM